MEAIEIQEYKSIQNQRRDFAKVWEAFHALQSEIVSLMKLHRVCPTDGCEFFPRDSTHSCPSLLSILDQNLNSLVLHLNVSLTESAKPQQKIPLEKDAIQTLETKTQENHAISIHTQEPKTDSSNITSSVPHHAKARERNSLEIPEPKLNGQAIDTVGNKEHSQNDLDSKQAIIILQPQSGNSREYNKMIKVSFPVVIYGKFGEPLLKYYPANHVLL